MSIDLRDLNGYRQLPGQGPAADTAREPAGSKAEPGESTDRAASADRVELSSTARNLRALGESARTSEPVDAERVDRIRAEIAEGRYHVDAGKLADRMIDLERVLLG